MECGSEVKRCDSCLKMQTAVILSGAERGVEGSTQEFFVGTEPNAKILRLVSLAQDDNTVCILQIFLTF